MSLPELPSDIHTTTTVTGYVQTVNDRQLVVLPYAAPVSVSRGRRYRVTIDESLAVTRIVLSVRGQAVLRPPVLIPAKDGQATSVRLRALPARRPRRTPDDLRRALEDAGTTLNQLDEPAAQHLLLMITEAHDPAIRARRVQAAVEAALASDGLR